MSDSSHAISLADAVAMTSRAREAGTLSKQAWWFDRAILDEMMAQPDAQGVRIYLGLKEDGEPTLVITATDRDRQDIFTGTLAEFAWPCPPGCDAKSPLHTGD